MTGPRMRSVLVTGVLALLVARIVQVLRGAPMPATPRPAPSPRHPTVDGGLRPVIDRTGTPANRSDDIAAPTPPPRGAERGWVEPVDGTCPDGFPIKGKTRSGIFHEPGQFAYDRTVPDRCYRDAAAAAADGLRPAKR